MDYFQFVPKIIQCIANCHVISININYRQNISLNKIYIKNWSLRLDNMFGFFFTYICIVSFVPDENIIVVHVAVVVVFDLSDRLKYDRQVGEENAVEGEEEGLGEGHVVVGVDANVIQTVQKDLDLHGQAGIVLGQHVGVAVPGSLGFAKEDSSFKQDGLANLGSSI
jgi:hypothetical protein